MPTTPFVGREEELHELRAAVADQEGKVVLVIGGEGRGKSALLAELNRQLAEDPLYFPLLYQLNDKDMSDAFLGRLMDDLLHIGGLTKGTLVLGMPGQAQQWRGLLDTATGFGKVPVIGPLFQPVSSIAGLLKQLVRDDKRPMRERFLHFLRGIASRLEGAHRLVLILDPDKYLDESVEADWRAIAQQAPERVTIIFGQRPDDCLAGSPDFLTCRGVQCVPRAELPYLPRAQSDDLVRMYWASREEWRALAAEAPQELLDLLWDKYGGWALPLTMALEDMPPRLRTMPDLLRAAKRMPPELQRLLGHRLRSAVSADEDAVRVLRGLAVLGKPASLARVAALYGGMVSEERLARVCADAVVTRCLALGVGGAFRIAHDTLAEVILSTMAAETQRALHRRAADLYAADLAADGQDPEALDRITYHLYESGDEGAFLAAVDEFGPTKHRLRLLRSYLRDLEWKRSILRTLALEDPSLVSPLAAALSDLGALLGELGDRRQAVPLLEEALSIRRGLAAAEPERFAEDVASSLINLGVVLSDLGRKVEARQAHAEALAIRRRLATVDPGYPCAALATALVDMGAVLLDLGSWEGARRAEEEAVEVLRSAPRDRSAEALLATALHNLGNALADTSDQAGARQAYEESRAIWLKLSEDEPSAYNHHIASVMSNLASVLHVAGSLSDAFRAASEAVDMYASLAEVEPRAFGPRLALALNTLAGVLSSLERNSEAREAIQRALELVVPLADEEPAAYARQVSAMVLNARRLLTKAELPDSAMPVLARAFAVPHQEGPAAGAGSAVPVGPADEVPPVAPGRHGVPYAPADVQPQAEAAEPRDLVRMLARLMVDRRMTGLSPYVFVIGAGASVSSGVPQFADLIDAFLSDYCSPTKVAGLQAIADAAAREQAKRDHFFEQWRQFSPVSCCAFLKRRLVGAPSPGYADLAWMVCEGYVQLLLTTNLDELLETALAGSGLAMGSDYDVIVNRRGRGDWVRVRLEATPPVTKVVKLHGTVTDADSYAWLPEEVFEFEDELSGVLQDHLNQDVVIVGNRMDDRDLDLNFRRKGGEIWFVNPNPPTDSRFRMVLDVRAKSRLVLGKSARFDTFMGLLRSDIDQLSKSAP